MVGQFRRHLLFQSHFVRFTCRFFRHPDSRLPVYLIDLIISRLQAGIGSLVERFTPCQPRLLLQVDPKPPVRERGKATFLDLQSPDLCIPRARLSHEKSSLPHRGRQRANHTGHE